MQIIHHLCQWDQLNIKQLIIFYWQIGLNSTICLFLVPINTLCQGNQGDFRQHVPRPIDGAVVVSKNERDKDCTITFQTESILENFMIRFSKLNIDCNDKLMIFDGAHTYGNLVVSLEQFLVSKNGYSVCVQLGIK